MSKTYKGTLTLDWYNKQYALLLQRSDDFSYESDISAPKLNWINRDEALFYEIDPKEGIGVSPYWVDRNDIRVKEARPLLLKSIFKAKSKNKQGSLPGMDAVWQIEESHTDEIAIENLLIKGDNLLALNTLKKAFSHKPENEKVKCIFIDPPYNTGKAFSQYDDNLELSEWLTLMRDRLLVLYQLLAEEGFIWITLDDKGFFHLKILMDEIFGRENFLGNIVWQHSVQGKNDSKKVSLHHNYILCYRKIEDSILNQEERQDKHNVNYSNPDNDPNGPWRSGDVRSPHYRENLRFNIRTPSGKVIPPPENGWRWSEKEVQAKIKSKEIIFSEDESRIIRKIYLGNQEGRIVESIWFADELDSVPETIWMGKDVGTTREANKEILNLFGQNVFDTPKPERLIKKILHLSTQPGDIVLDSFAGSGTTLSVAHKMGRKWIGVEIGNQAEEVIIPRLKKVLSGADELGVSKELAWNGGGEFKFYQLGDSIILPTKDGSGDFNWKLGKQFIEESFLLSYDYKIENSIDLTKGDLFPDSSNKPTIGVQSVGGKKRVAVISLNEPKGNRDQLSYDEIFHIYSVIKKKLTPEYINIFTNKGLELAFDSKPDDLEIIKVPHAIFSELEK